MANILEFLRGVLTDAEHQGAFRADPAGYLDRAGFADLTGEDVVEAVSVLRRSLGPDAANALAPFDDEVDLPAVRPANDEREFDAALRLLEFAVARVPVSADGAPGGNGADAARDDEGADHVEADAEAELDLTAAPASPSVPAAPSAPSAPLASGAVTVDVSTLPSVQAFSESLAAAAADARTRFDDAVRRIVADAATEAELTAMQYAELLQKAADDANRLREEATADIARMREEAAADRAAAVDELARTRAEADELLGRARAQVDEARRQSDDLLNSAQAEADASRAEIDARRTELRDAERQLKERLSGIDTLFRTVLRDEEGHEGGIR